MRMRGGSYVPPSPPIPQGSVRGGCQLDFTSVQEKRTADRKEAAKKASETRAKNRLYPSQRFFTSYLQLKIRRKAFDNLTSGEILGIYLEGYRRRFDKEDPDFQKSSDFERERGIISGRIRDWFGGDKYLMYRYVVNTLEWWKRRLETAASFPTSLPSFGAVFGGTHFFKNYSMNCKEIGVEVDQ